MRCAQGARARRREHEGATERGRPGPVGGFHGRPPHQPHPSNKQGLQKGLPPSFPTLPRAPPAQLYPCLAADGAQQRVCKSFNMYT
jgi:hypothetical protein